MNLVDSSGWLSFFEGTGRGTRYAEILEDSENLLVPSITLYEVFSAILKTSGKDIALKAAARMRQGVQMEIDGTIAIEAARLSSEHGLSMSGAMVLACARRRDAVLYSEGDDISGPA